MSKRYLNDMMFSGAMRYLNAKYELTEVRGDYWIDWYLGPKHIAAVCSSPHPGPEYGSIRWVDHELTTGVEVVIRRSRHINWTEAHVINERLEYMKQYHRPQPAEQRCTLIPEVERAYESILANDGFTGRVGAGSFIIYWNECAYLD